MEKINIADLLRNCLTGMELNCMTYQDVYFDYVDELNIIHCYIQHETHKTSITFNQYGTPNSDIKSKCVIFPKGKFTWAGFHRPFKDGDVIYNKDINALAIFYKQTDVSTISHCFLNVMGELRICHYHSKDLSDWKFATKEEKEKLFQAIKANGYRWNSETKILEKLINKNKFVVGATITNGKLIGKIVSRDVDSYQLEDGNYVFFDEVYNWELVPDNWVVPNKLASQVFKIGDRIRHKDTGIYCTLEEYSEGISAYRTNIGLSITYKDLKQWELAHNKFDINTLKPFDKVLVRKDNKHVWSIQFFERLNTKLKDSFVCMGCYRYRQCIPYEGNEHLLNTTNDCDNCFKVWEE